MLYSLQEDQSFSLFAIGEKKILGDGHLKLETHGGLHKIFTMIGPPLNIISWKVKDTLRLLVQEVGMTLTCLKLEMED